MMLTTQYEQYKILCRSRPYWRLFREVITSIASIDTHIHHKYHNYKGIFATLSQQCSEPYIVETNVFCNWAQSHGVNVKRNIFTAQDKRFCSRIPQGQS